MKMIKKSLKRMRATALKQLPCLIIDVSYAQVEATEKVKSILLDESIEDAVESMGQFFNALKNGFKTVESKLLDNESDHDIKKAINCLISLEKEFQEAKKFINSIG